MARAGLDVCEPLSPSTSTGSTNADTMSSRLANPALARQLAHTFRAWFSARRISCRAATLKDAWTHHRCASATARMAFAQMRTRALQQKVIHRRIDQCASVHTRATPGSEDVLVDVRMRATPRRRIRARRWSRASPLDGGALHALGSWIRSYSQLSTALTLCSGQQKVARNFGLGTLTGLH